MVATDMETPAHIAAVMAVASEGEALEEVCFVACGLLTACAPPPPTCMPERQHPPLASTMLVAPQASAVDVTTSTACALPSRTSATCPSSRSELSHSSALRLDWQQPCI